MKKMIVVLLVFLFACENRKIKTTDDGLIEIKNMTAPIIVKSVGSFAGTPMVLIIDAKKEALIIRSHALESLKQGDTLVHAQRD